MGHGFSRIVSEVGMNVSSLVAGDHVAVDSLRSCGHRWHCTTGRRNRCESLGFIGLSSGDGDLAERVAVPA